MPNSLRLRLPLSYAAVALLAVLALGALLLVALRGYYRQRELDFLAANAAVIADSVALSRRPADALSPGSLQAQVAGMAFLTQTRLRLLDPGGAVLADSGAPGAADGTTRIALDVTVGDVAQTFSQSVAQSGDQATASFSSSIVVADAAFSRNVDQTVVISQTAGSPPAVWLPTSGTLFGLGLTPDQSVERSSLVVRRPVFDQSGAALGTVELSEGPAYGRAILRSVAWGWAAAGAAAVLLAALAGWLISRGITAPLLALTTATQHMAGGDLAARAAPTARADEIGLLTRSFNGMAARLEGTVVALRRFVADAAHEIHTPLTALQSDLDLLAGSADAAAQPRLLRARQQAHRLEQLTADLLDLSRLEAEAGHAAHTPLDLAQALRHLVEPYASRAEQSDVAFSLHVPPGPLVVRGDAGQLRRALGNLLDNAVKFTPAGGTVAVTLVDEEGWAVVRVVDSGIGIPPDELHLLFNRFHRGRNAAAYPGSGLGLAIAHAVAIAHGGTLTAASEPGATTVTLRLPR